MDAIKSQLERKTLAESVVAARKIKTEAPEIIDQPKKRSLK